MEAIFSSFFLVAVSEMGDKTQLLAFSLAARYKKPWPIMAGILAATLLNHALAAYAGDWFSRLLSGNVLRYVLAVSFIGFGLWTLKPDSLEETEHPKAGVFLTTAILFFLAEMGDKTQLATLALGAQFKSIIAVTFGTTAGMLVSDGLAVFTGEKFAEKIRMQWIRYFAAALFFLFGFFQLYLALS